jgi:large subunit ribosomal protein L6
LRGDIVTVKGPKGTMTHRIPSPIEVSHTDGTLVVTRPNDERASRSLHGLTRTLLANLVTGVTDGYEKKLEIVGTGYRVVAKGSDLEFRPRLQPPGLCDGAGRHHVHC